MVICIQCNIIVMTLYMILISVIFSHGRDVCVLVCMAQHSTNKLKVSYQYYQHYYDTFMGEIFQYFWIVYVIVCSCIIPLGFIGLKYTIIKSSVNRSFTTNFHWDSNPQPHDKHIALCNINQSYHWQRVKLLKVSFEIQWKPCTS